MTNQAIKELELALRQGYGPQGVWVPMKGLLRVFNNKWSFLILLNLQPHQWVRFNELKTGVSGISARMLSKSLVELEQLKLITRRDDSGTVLRVVYGITLQGETLLLHLSAMLACFSTYFHSSPPLDAASKPKS
jgi:DNA-binding HxlR family transcriptional regulator